MNISLLYSRATTLVLMVICALFYNPAVLAKDSILPDYVHLKDGHHKIVLPDSAIYDGMVRNGRLEGKGILVWRNGEKYIGEFKNGLRHGQGEFVDASGGRYIGKYKNGLEDGQGTYTFSHGEKYQGEMRNGNMHGRGKYYFSSGDIYSGDFQKGSAEGQGEYVYANGAKYNGQIKKWRLHGNGIFEYDNGDRYEGEFKDGLFHGKAVYYINKAEGGKNKIEGVWEAGQYQYADLESGKEIVLGNGFIDAEEVLLDQERLLNEALKGMQRSRPNITDLYFVAFGSYSDQDVFMKESLYSKEQVEKLFDAENRSLALVNNRKSLSQKPLATVRNLRSAVMSMAALMDKEEDVLFLGSSDFSVG